MQKINKIILPYIFLLLPYVVHAWGDGDMLDNGACKFNKETGYSGFSLFIKSHDESYVIVDVKDSRYGTTSTVYNSKTCKKVTSGDKSESNFEALMEKKGFIQTPLSYQYTIDKSYQNKIYFSQNEDNIVVKVEEIDSKTTRELKTLLSSLSDKSVSTNITISSSAKEFLGYKQFYNTYTEKLSSLSPMEINYNYALSLNDKFKIENGYAENSKNIILAKQEEMQKIILAKQESTRKRVARNNSHTSSTSSNYDDGYDPVLAAGVILGGVAVYKMGQAIGDLFSSSSSSSYSSYTPPSYDSCHSGDTCHKIIEVIEPHRIKIQCTRGFNTGRKREMCSNSKGYWATGCGFTDIAAHHYKNLTDAARNWCY
jgi:type II secretory pathway component GspD/PulD (secretin)